jgi:hypothetical protein
MKAKLIGVCLLVSACSANDRSANPPADTWDRTRQCADRGDAYARELRDEAGTAPIQVSDWTTHYNATHGRCYVLVGFFNRNASLADPRRPLSVQRLYDAFERRDVAAFTSQQLDAAGEDVWCRQTDETTGESSSPPCKTVGTYIAQLMRQ